MPFMSSEQFHSWCTSEVRAYASRGDRGAAALRTAGTGKSSPRIRRAASIGVIPAGGRLRVTNFLTLQAFSCRQKTIALLAELDDWTEVSSLRGHFADEPADWVADHLARLAELGALVVEGSAHAELDQRYRARWEWGPSAGWFHFANRDVRFGTEEQKEQMIRERAAVRPSPPLHQTNEGLSAVVVLPPPADSSMLRTMRARRSQRDFDRRPLDLGSLGAILHAGLGITGFHDEGPFGVLPYKMAPSGGARNPYEGYVLAANVTGLPPGLYHHCALEGSLGLVRPPPLPPPSRLLADLPWTDGAAAVIFLVANFPRTMWKYAHPRAYRVVLLEAGHIAQNMLLAATEAGLGATPIAAVQDSVAECAFNLDPVEQAAVHAVVLGHPRAPKR